MGFQSILIQFHTFVYYNYVFITDRTYFVNSIGVSSSAWKHLFYTGCKVVHIKRAHAA